MNIPLYIAFAACCLGSLWQSARTTRYFRIRYPEIWSRFGFVGNGISAPSKAVDEKKDLLAAKQFRIFLKSAECQALNDLKLNQLIQLQRFLQYVGFVLFVSVISVWAYTLW